MKKSIYIVDLTNISQLSFEKIDRTLSPLIKLGTKMTHDFKVGDHVRWNSEAGYVTGIIKKKITSEIVFKGYTVHASQDEPQYMIHSDKTDHIAMHKGTALEKIK
jgi:hypothetical protein